MLCEYGILSSAAQSVVFAQKGSQADDPDAPSVMSGRPVMNKLHAATSSKLAANKSVWHIVCYIRELFVLCVATVAFVCNTE